MPELLWKAYVDFEAEEGERESARALYERLLALSGHVKVWISYALFEAEAIPIPRALREEEEEGNNDEESEPQVVEGNVNLARQVFDRGYKELKKKGLKSEVCQRCHPPILTMLVICGTDSVLHFWRYGNRLRKTMVLWKTSKR